MKLDMEKLAWEKMNGLLTAVVQHSQTRAVLMVGYMNQEALQKTIETKKVTFYSRSKGRLWTKGEISGNQLELVNIFSDCDQDSLLIYANPTGPICHIGTSTCFGEFDETVLDTLQDLAELIKQREQLRPEHSYTAELFNSGISRIAQKVGEESIEVVLAAIDKNDEEFCGEVADLLFHLLVLLRSKNLTLADVTKVLRDRR